MSWMLQLAGGAVAATGTLRGARADSASLRLQAAASQQQANRDEESVRRTGRQTLGTQAAAMAQAGGGVDAGVLGQTAANQELEALNTRYAGQMRAYGLVDQAARIKSNSKLLAGAQLLSSGAGAYQSYQLSH